MSIRRGVRTNEKTNEHDTTTGLTEVCVEKEVLAKRQLGHALKSAFAVHFGRQRQLGEGCSKKRWEKAVGGWAGETGVRFEGPRRVDNPERAPTSACRVKHRGGGSDICG